MKPDRWCLLLAACSILVTCCEPSLSSAEVTLEKVISHEDAKFDIPRSRMTIGRDGRLLWKVDLGATCSTSMTRAGCWCSLATQMK